MAVASTALVTLPSVAIGIIAFGSLLTDAGRELDAVTERLEPGLTTPFAVEFARSSTTRDGAPTLVPFPTGGPVRCAVIVLRESVGREEAYDLLFRRELHQVGSTESYWSRRRGWIHEEPSFGTVELALYTALRANIEPLTVALEVTRFR